MFPAASPLEAPPRFRRLGRRPRAGWIGFEGIVASGKTTQSRLLAKRFPTGAEVVPEFGDHDLGRYLSRFGSPGMRLAPEGCETSYVRHLLALSSHVQKLAEVSRRARRNVVLLDVATLTDAVFALADLPAEVGSDLRAAMTSAVESMIALARPWAADGVLIYLDCDPKVAAERLAKRGTPVEDEDVDFLFRMYDAYEHLLRGREDVRRIDANRDVNEVAADVRARVGHLVR